MSDFIFKPEERAVFGPYFDGARSRYADPLSVHRALTLHLEGDPNHWLGKLGAEEVPVRLLAEEKVLQAARVALVMTPFNSETGEGALDSDVQVALDLYLEWMEKKGLRGATYPTSQTPTGGLPSVGPSITSPSWASGSTSPDCGCSGHGR